MSSVGESDNLDTEEINSFHAAKSCHRLLLFVVAVVVVDVDVAAEIGT